MGGFSSQPSVEEEGTGGAHTLPRLIKTFCTLAASLFVSHVAGCTSTEPECIFTRSETSAVLSDDLLCNHT